MTSFPPHLWTILIGNAEKKDFVKIDHLSGLEVYKYAKGKWPVKKNLYVPPGILKSQNIKAWMSMYCIMCPLCQCIAVKNERNLKTSKKKIECSGWDGQVYCPGYFVNFIHSDNTCSIH